SRSSTRLARRPPGPRASAAGPRPRRCRRARASIGVTRRLDAIASLQGLASDEGCRWLVERRGHRGNRFALAFGFVALVWSRSAVGAEPRAYDGPSAIVAHP